jgi:translation elongation factor EF-1alpha
MKPENHVKVLLLGPADSGKTTILKQVLLFHGMEFVPEELKAFKIAIYRNIISNMQKLLNSMKMLGLYHDDEDLEVNLIF